MKKIKLLIVEDDKGLIDLYTNYFPAETIEMYATTHGESALRIYRNKTPDVILLDVKLPTITGYSVLKQIREDFQDTRTPVIMTTAVTRKKEMLGCVKIGIQGYFIKPFKIWEVYKKILACTDRSNDEIETSLKKALQKKPDNEDSSAVS